MADLEARLELALDDALSGISQIDERLGSAVTDFKTGLADALNLLTGVEVTADAAPVTAAVNDAIGAADLSPAIDADTGGMTEQIDQAVGSADATITPDVAADAVTQDIDNAINAADTTVTVEADTSQAEDALAGLGDSGSEAGKGLSDAASGAGDAAGGLDLVAPAAGFAAGELGGLKDVVGKFGPEAAGAAAATFGLVEAGKSLFEGALEQRTAVERLNRVFGDTADAVEHINLGGINEDLDKLALETGSNVDGLRNFAATFGQLGIDSGHAKEEVAGTVDQIIALASRASVLNPALGSADEIVQRLSTSLARGGRFLSNYGISLTSAEIQARALIDTGKQSAAELTVFEKATAGAEIATERLGKKLGADITTGAQSDAIQVRRLGVELEEAKKKAAAALVEPVTESMKQLVPVATDLVVVLGAGLTGALRTLAPALDLVGFAAKQLAGPLNAAGDLVGGFEQAINPAVGLFDVISGGSSSTDSLANATKHLADQQNQQAHASLIASVSAGQLSREVEVAAIKEHTAKDGTVDWVGVLDQLKGTLDTTASKSDDYSTAVADQAKATKDAAQGSQDFAQAQLGTLVATGQLTQAQLDHLAALNLTKEGTTDYVAALQSVDPAAAKVAADQALIAGGLNTTATQFTLAKDEAALYSEQFDQMVGPFLNAEKAQSDFTDKVDAALSEYANAKIAADAYKTTMSEFVDPALAAGEAQIKLLDTIDKTNATLAANKGAFDVKTKAGRDDEQAVIDLVKAYNSEIDAMIASGDTTAQVNTERQSEIDKLNDLKRVYPGLTGTIDEYEGRLKDANASGEEARRVTEAHQAALEGVIESGDKWIQTLIATGTNETGIADARQQEIDKLTALKAQYPELGGVIDTYIAKLGAIPPSKDTFINLPNTIQNEVDLTNIHDAIERLKAKGVPITVENVQKALNDAAAVKGGIEAIPRNWNTNVDVNVNGLSTLRTTESLLREFIDHPDINVNANIVANIAAGVDNRKQAGGPVDQFDIITTNEIGQEPIVLGSPGFVVSHSEALKALGAVGADQPAIDYDRLTAALLRARPVNVTVNSVAHDEEATATAVTNRLGEDSFR